MLNITRFHPSAYLLVLGKASSFSIVSVRHQSTRKGDEKLHENFPLIDTKFDEYRLAYQYRNNLELFRGYLVYRLFSVNAFVNNQEKIAKWSRRLLGDRIFNALFKISAFGHFVGGENPMEIIPIVKRLQKYNVHPILDYSVESDASDANSLSLNDLEQVHDRNADKFIECIETAHNLSGENSAIAIKVTALVRPAVLQKFNELLKATKDPSSASSIFEFINQIPVKNTTISFSGSDVDSLIFESKNDSMKDLSIMTHEECSEIYRLLLRLNKIAKAGVEKKTFIMVDAEQTYFQTAINYLANQLQRYYNKNAIPVIYGTYQCYLKNTLDVLKTDLIAAEKHGYKFAAKLVRGAYMEQERRLAEQHGYQSPINASFEATSEMYHSCLDQVMTNIERRGSDMIRIMIASHNENTIRYAIGKMKDHQILPSSSTVSFASLYGMSDYIGFTLAHSGYQTYKYLPYGPIELLQPYLFRRAQENRSIFEKAEKDRRLHLQALKDRFLKAKN